MQRILFLASVLLLAGIGMTAQTAGAASLSPQATLLRADQSEDSLVHRAQEGKRPLGKIGGYYSRCYYWRRECRRRWGWGSRRYASCVALHFCRLRPAR